MKKKFIPLLVLTTLVSLGAVSTTLTSCGGGTTEQTSDKYSITVDATSTEYVKDLSLSEAERGTKITFKVTGVPADKKVVSVKFNNTECSNEGDGYYFLMPSSNVVIKVTLADVTKYNISVDEASTSFVSELSATSAAEGTTVKFKVTVPEGSTILSVKANATSCTLADGFYSFTMPANDVVITVSVTDSLEEFAPIKFDETLASRVTVTGLVDNEVLMVDKEYTVSLALKEGFELYETENILENFEFKAVTPSGVELISPIFENINKETKTVTFKFANTEDIALPKDVTAIHFNVLTIQNITTPIFVHHNISSDYMFMDLMGNVFADGQQLNPNKLPQELVNRQFIVMSNLGVDFHINVVDASGAVLFDGDSEGGYLQIIINEQITSDITVTLTASQAPVSKVTIGWYDNNLADKLTLTSDTLSIGGTVEPGSTHTVTITPKKGYEIDGPIYILDEWDAGCGVITPNAEGVYTKEIEVPYGIKQLNFDCTVNKLPTPVSRTIEGVEATYNNVEQYDAVKLAWVKVTREEGETVTDLPLTIRDTTKAIETVKLVETTENVENPRELPLTVKSSTEDEAILADFVMPEYSSKIVVTLVDFTHTLTTTLPESVTVEWIKKTPTTGEAGVFNLINRTGYTFKLNVADETKEIDTVEFNGSKITPNASGEYSITLYNAPGTLTATLKEYVPFEPTPFDGKVFENTNIPMNVWNTPTKGDLTFTFGNDGTVSIYVHYVDASDYDYPYSGTYHSTFTYDKDTKALVFTYNNGRNTIDAIYNESDNTIKITNTRQLPLINGLTVDSEVILSIKA